jgi:hypothetical protein
MEAVLERIRKEVEIEINDNINGYKIKKTHFEVGKNIHCQTYYFARRFFTNTKRVDDLGELLLDKLKTMSLIDTTLIGYGEETGLLLKKISDVRGMSIMR